MIKDFCAIPSFLFSEPRLKKLAEDYVTNKEILFDKEIVDINLVECDDEIFEYTVAVETLNKSIFVYITVDSNSKLYVVGIEESRGN